jgi:fructose-bisphosphate aldolase class II
MGDELVRCRHLDLAPHVFLSEFPRMHEELLKGAITLDDGKVTVNDEAAIASAEMDALVREAVFGDQDAKDNARWLIWEIGQNVGVIPSSIHDLYLARGRGEVSGYTVPAINVRGMAYDTARAIFRTAIKLDAGAFICEIARSEIAYTDQRPAEYVAVIMAAALREGWRGPLFIQGDHFQVSVKKFAVDPVAEVDAVKQLAREAVAAGFYNIDIDTSTLVDLSKPNLVEQQRLNFEQAADIASFIRGLQPDAINISLGGEIGEVGTENSTVAELTTFMDGFNSTLKKIEPGLEGLSKISVQSGTTHGGTVLPDGTIADVKIDFDTLKNLSVVAREKYGLAGAVQHGASTLPDGDFNHFPKTETAEIHLATNFQTMLYDRIPDDLRREIYDWLLINAKDERKSTDTDDQFFYKTRKKALGAFKRRFWDLDKATKAALAKAYDDKFNFLFNQLGIPNTAADVANHIKTVRQHRPQPHEGMVVVAAAPDDADLSD